MKIVHIITRLIIGGAQENTLLSCEGQHKLGHDVTLITGPAIGPEGSLLDRAQGQGYRVIVVDEMRRAIRPGRASPPGAPGASCTRSWPTASTRRRPAA